jgi:myo-inositol-1(or 4)-monophosphatase
LPVADSEIQAALILAEAAAREAGALALEMSRAPIRQWIKGASSPVSEVDIAADDLLKKRLLGATPDYGWLSEETVDDAARLSRPLTWVVDPIDGTRAFLAGRTDWSVSAALVDDGRPILAAVFAPAEDAMYFAALGQGAFCNEQPLSTSLGGGLDRARVAGPRRHLDRLEQLVPQIAPQPRVHSLALRLARVAQGALDAALVSSSSRDWDLAAAALLVHEAHGALTTIAGEPLVYNRPKPVHGALVAAGQQRHRALTELLRGRRAEFH